MPPSASPLIVAPGILEDETGWRELLPGQEVIVLPHRGDSIQAMAQALLERAPARFGLLGHSLGTYVALWAAGLAPERVERLALICASARAETDANRAARAALVEAARGDFAGTMARVARAAVAPENRAAAAPALEAMLRRGDLARFAREQQAAASRPALDGVARALTLPVPVLVVAGSADAIIPAAAARELAALVPGARHVELPGCGHTPQLECPEELGAALRGWLTQAV